MKSSFFSMNSNCFELLIKFGSCRTAQFTMSMKAIVIVVLLLSCLWQFSSGDDRKIAFLFLTKGPLPMEDIWREFFRWRANSSHYSVYVHPHFGYKYPTTSFFHGKDIPDKVNVKWGGMTQVKAIKRLVQAALKDPLNTWFTLMSETCIPLIPFPKFRSILLANNKSVVNACAMSAGEMETDTRWRPTLDAVGLKKSDWRKSATWFALTRKHAEVFVNETKTEEAWDAVPCCDEHYLPTMLAYNGLDNETTCTDGFAHVNWPSLIASHPRTYNGDEINAELFAFLERSVGATAGFSQQCSGFEQICHFTARKFAATAKYQLLENLDLILSEDGHPYTGNPWDHHQDKIRFKSDENKYFLIENGVLREIPDDHTFNALHLKKNGSAIQAWSESEGVPMGPPFPSRKDGLILKTKKNNQVWYLKDGHRHAIPNIATFQSMNLSFENLLIVSDSDLDQINVGHSIPSV